MTHNGSITPGREYYPAFSIQTKLLTKAIPKPRQARRYQNRLVHTTWAFFLSRNPRSISWLPPL